MTGRVLTRRVESTVEFEVIAEFEYWGDAEGFFLSDYFKMQYPTDRHEAKMQIRGIFSGWKDHHPEDGGKEQK